MRRTWSVTKWMSWGFSALTVAAVFGMVALFIWQSIPAWKHEGTGFITGAKWYYRQSQFGTAPMIYGSIIVTLIAVLLAAPIAIGAAIFTSEFLPGRLRLLVKLIIELLAGVPSVVYGLLGILVLRPWIYELLTPLDPLSGDTLLTAGVLLGVMILPTIMTLADDALRGIPASNRFAARGLGLTATETVLHVSLPQAMPGMIAAVLLGIGRALGETIAVFLVVGRQDNQWPEKLLSWIPATEAGQTLTSKLGGSEINIAYSSNGSELHWSAMVGLGVLLLGLVSIIILVSARLRTTDHAS